MSAVIVPALTEADVAGLTADLASKAETGGHDALSVVGRSANTSGDADDIVANNDAEVLRRSGTALGFGTIATAGIANNAVDDTKLRDSGALSVIGRSANSSGDPADISTSVDGDVLRRSGTSLGFGTIATAGITDAAVTYAKIQDVSASSRILGRISSGSGDVEELTAANVQTILGNTGSLAIAKTSAPSTLNLTTEGTIDWFANLAATNPRLLNNGVLHAKIAGGYIAKSFEMFSGGATTTTYTTFGTQQPTQTTTGTDDCATTALTNNATNGFTAIASATQVGAGFTFRVPALNSSRVLRVYTGNYSCIITVTATLADGSASPASTTNDQAANTASNQLFTITYKSAQPCDLIVVCQITTNQHDGSNNLNCGCTCVTLATS